MTSLPHVQNALTRSDQTMAPPWVSTEDVILLCLHHFARNHTDRHGKIWELIFTISRRIKNESNPYSNFSQQTRWLKQHASLIFIFLLCSRRCGRRIRHSAFARGVGDGIRHSPVCVALQIEDTGTNRSLFDWTATTRVSADSMRLKVDFFDSGDWSFLVVKNDAAFGWRRKLELLVEAGERIKILLKMMV